MGVAIQQFALYWDNPRNNIVVYASYESIQLAIEKICDVGSLFCFVNSNK